MKAGANKFGREIKDLVDLTESRIDTSDIPEVSDWSEAVVGKFYRPIKEPVTIRLDADILAWLKAQGPGYQTRINSLLRSTMTPHANNLHKKARHGDRARRQKPFSSMRLRKRNKNK
jgi:uncharacterized protein (DUF4415 family)